MENIYTGKRNLYTSEIKCARNQFIKENIELNKKDPKKMWCLLKDLLKQKRNEPDSIIFNGISVENEKTISEKFNNYFVDSIKEINKNIEVIPNQVLTIKHNSSEFK